MLEKDTNDLGTTIHFDQKNFNTFGFRVFNLFFLACNLFEYAAKEIERNPKSDMKKWKINPKISGLSETELIFKPTGDKFKPLKGLGYRFVESRTLTWWNDYNSAKHNLSLSKATLKKSNLCPRFSWHIGRDCCFSGWHNGFESKYIIR